ncbi:DUF397 domain-containing protein [Actinomadura geliboluensis]|uniref:DUF397 domain-containing protein n=1 Tax=Actinomadura geliboluensis TaxID=882440 RepID=UPI0036C35DE9
MDNSNIVWRKSSRSAAEGHCIEVAMWRTSSYSAVEGECIEVAAWRTSNYSANNGSCVEVAAAPHVAVVLARDSKDPDGPVLGFGAGAWAAFLDAVKSGRLDLA